MRFLFPAAVRPRPMSRPDWAPLARLPVVLLAGLALLFLVAPIAVLAWRSLAGPAWGRLSDSAVVDAVALSFATTAVSVALTLLFGTPLAYALARWRFPLRGAVAVLVELPIVLPPAVAGLALLLTFGRRGFFGPALESGGIALPFTTAAVVLAQVFVSAPFYIRSAQVGFESLPPDVEDAARVDGAGPVALARHVTLPLASRALAAGLALSWARALGEFGATILFAGSLQGRTQTMPLLIYAILERDIEAAVASGVLLVGLALALLLLSRWLGRLPAGDTAVS